MPHWLQRLGLEFWLPLPLLAIAFWLGGSWLTNWALSRSYGTENRLQIASQLQLDRSVDVLLIEAQINLTAATTQVTVRELSGDRETFTLTTTAVDEIEQAIAQRLDISREDTRELLRYQQKND